MKIIVIGGGPAGIMAAIIAANHGADVELWERNKQLGRKLAITGKGRCNITNAVPNREELVKNIPGNGVFLHSAFARFAPDDTMAFFRTAGLELKIERGRRVFPASDKAEDVITTLESCLEQARVTVRRGIRAKKLAIEKGTVTGVYDYSGTFHKTEKLIIATGGKTYPATGSTGDGYILAKQAGHSITSLNPSLVPLETEEIWPSKISGLALKNVEAKIFFGEKQLDKAFGELLFTHFGLSGPIILSLSKSACAQSGQGKGMRVIINLKPALSTEQLDQRLQRNNAKFSRKLFRNSLNELLPSSLIPIFIDLCNIDGDKPVNQLTREDRNIVCQIMQGLPLTLKGARPIEEAIVTAGGVSIQEIIPKTMASKLVKGLHFAGEVMDVDGYTGGYNLQIAWSSGYIAGISAASI